MHFIHPLDFTLHFPLIQGGQSTAPSACKLLSRRQQMNPCSLATLPARNSSAAENGLLQFQGKFSFFFFASPFLSAYPSVVSGRGGGCVAISASCWRTKGLFFHPGRNMLGATQFRSCGTVRRGINNVGLCCLTCDAYMVTE